MGLRVGRGSAGHRPAPPFTRHVASYDARRHAGNDAAIWNLSQHDRTRSHHDLVSYVGTRQDDDPGPQPCTTPDVNCLVNRPLQTDRRRQVLVAVVLVRYVDIRTGVDIVFDVDAEVSHQMAPPADAAPVTDLQNRIGEHILSRDHARRKGDVRPNDRSGAYVDPALAEDSAGRECYAASRTKGSEAVGTWIARAGDARAACPFPERVNGGCRQTSEPWREIWQPCHGHDASR